MALKKSQLYSSLWESCDELRGGMDASQYKDYILTLLFVKYVSDKWAGKPHALIEVPPGHHDQRTAEPETGRCYGIVGRAPAPKGPIDLLDGARNGDCLTDLRDALDAEDVVEDRPAAYGY